MKGLFNFIVSPKGNKYNNIKKLGDKELITNTHIEEFKNINREAIIKSLPSGINTSINIGDEVIIHHNIFRQSYDDNGKIKESNFIIQDDLYFCPLDCIFLYKRNKQWNCIDEYCFVKPIINTNRNSLKHENPDMGIIKYSDGSFNVDDLVGFNPKINHEYIINGELLYKVKSNLIEIKYEYQGNEEEYNPSWA